MSRQRLRRIAAPALAILAVAGWVGLASSAGAATANPLSKVDSVHFINAKTGWAEADSGRRLLITFNGGRRWSDITPPQLRARDRVLAGFGQAGGGLTSAQMLSETDLWVSVINLNANDRLPPVVVLNSTNGGRTWIERGAFRRAENAWLSFTSRSRGWLMVDNGAAMGSDSVTVYRTSNGGRRWTMLARSANPTLWAGTRDAPVRDCDKTGISVSAGGDDAWITGYCSAGITLQRSASGGRTWSAHVLATPWGGGYLEPPRFFGASDAVMTGGLGLRTKPAGTYDRIFTSSDGGATWTEHRPPVNSEGPMDVVSATDWIVAEQHTFYVTRDGGATWARVHSAIAPGGVAGDVLDFIGPTDGWAVTAAGGLWHTTNGGHSWRQQ